MEVFIASRPVTDFKVLAEKFDKWHDAIESVRDDEQESFDNLPESLQSSREDDHDTIIDVLETAVDFLGQTEEDMLETDEPIDSWLDSLQNNIDELQAL